MLERGEVDGRYNGPHILNGERTFGGNAIGREEFIYRGPKESAIDEEFKRYGLF